MDWAHTTSVSWVGRYPGGILLLPHAGEFISQLSAEDILTHYFDDWRDLLKTVEGPIYSESSLILHSIEVDQVERDLFESLFELGLKMSFVGGEFQGSFIFHKPDVEDVKKEARSIVKELSKEDSLHDFKANKIHVDITKETGTKYFYGTLEVRKFPLPKSCRLLVIPKHESSLDLKLESDIIPVEHPFCTALLSILSSLSFERRLELGTIPHFRFLLPSGEISYEEMVATCCLSGN